MVKVKEDLTGKQFGRLTVLKQVEDYVKPNGEHVAKWLCRCKCGNETDIRGDNLKRNESQSCGCFKREIALKVGLANKKCNIYDNTIYHDQNGDYMIGYCSNTHKKFSFDLEDYKLIKNYCWSEYKGINNYSCLSAYNPKTKKLLKFHQLITGKIFIDHINHDTFNNRKYNLRHCTPQENSMNSGIRKDNKSGVIGVRWDKRRNKWYACIKIKGKNKFLGYSEDKNKAIELRLVAEKDLFGEFAPQEHLFNQYNIK